MNRVTIIYSDQDPFNPDPCVLRAEADPHDSIGEVMSRYGKEFHKIHFIFEGHPAIEQEFQESEYRVSYATDLYKHVITEDMQFRWRWYVNTRTALMDNQISADKAHDATVCLMRRLFDVEPVEPAWYDGETPPCNNAICEVLSPTPDNGHKMLLGTYYNDTWRDSKTHQLIDVILWRYL